MRDNYRLMSSLVSSTRLKPRERIEKLRNLHQRFNDKEITTEFAQLNLKLDSNFFHIPARILPPENITFNPSTTITSAVANWKEDIKNKRCFNYKKLDNWILITTSNDVLLRVPFLRLSSRCVRVRVCVCVCVCPFISLIETMRFPFL